jgi:Bacterial Ig-like domain (group 1)
MRTTASPLSTAQCPPLATRRWNPLGRGTRSSSVPRCLQFAAFLGLLTALSSAQVSVLTYHNDNSRDGQNTSETLLTTTNVNSASFGKLFSYSVDGFVAAQPLYMPNVQIGGNTHNVVFVATQHDSVFAFDADGHNGSAPLWQVSLINPAQGITSIPINEQGCNGVTGYPEMGIQGTPVIDPIGNTMYVVAKTKTLVGQQKTYQVMLHALDITTGAEKFGGPVQITGSVQLSGGGTLVFNSLTECQRPGLLFSNGVLYIGFGSNGCDLKALGWLFAYEGSTLQQLAVLNVAPNDTYGANIWEGGDGLAMDTSGNLYLATGNGTFDANTGGNDYGDSVLKIILNGSALQIIDYFTPYNQLNMAANDLDLGSGGVMLLPTQTGTSTPNLLIAAGKVGDIYLINQNDLGEYNPNNNDQIVQWIPGALAVQYGSPAYWNDTVYFAAQGDPVKAFSLINGVLSTTPIAESPGWAEIGSPSISANGAVNGIVWLVHSPSNPILSAMNALNLTQIYSTNQNPTRDGLGAIAHFVTPTIANGRVYVGTACTLQMGTTNCTSGQTPQLVVYGLFPTLSTTGGNNQSGTAGTTLPIALSVQTLNPYTGEPIGGATVTFSDGNAHGTFGTPVVKTGSNGVASTTYTLPTKAGSISITATSPGYVGALFSVTAVAGSPVSIGLSSGGQQTGTVGSPLPNPIVVKLKDSNGNGVPGQSVTFSDNSTPTGSFSPNPATTDSTGSATTTYTLPTVPGSITVTAKNGNLSLNVSEKAIAGSPASVGVVAGNHQSAPPNTQLPSALVVQVSDQYGNPVSGVSVAFADGGAGGTFSSPNPTTSSNGRASTMYTTSGTAGSVTITATVSGLTPAQFNETVQ